MDCYTVLTAVFLIIALKLYHSGNKKKSISRKPNDFSDKSYVTTVLKTPILSGLSLKLSVWIMESKLGKMLLAEHLFETGGMSYFRNIKLTEHPNFYPNHPGTMANVSTKDQNESVPSGDDMSASEDSIFPSIKVLQALYKSKSVTPLEVATNSLAAIKQMEKLNIFIRYDAKSVLEMAKASTERYAKDAPLSPIDGMIVGIKDEFKVKGLLCTKGLGFDMGGVCAEDSMIVHKLRTLGAIILGVTNMHEIGIGTTGINPNKGFGACRNPYNIKHVTGGSSSGSAAAVASGICTFAIGTDGGGSIRLPAAFCGLVGLKATFGRYTLGKAEVSAYTVTHSGALCSNVSDSALVYSLIAGSCVEYPIGSYQPKPVSKSSKSLKEFKICFDERWFKDCEADVLIPCEAAINVLNHDIGMEVDQIEIAELYDVLLAHRIIITGEMYCGMKDVMKQHGSKVSYPTRALLSCTDLISTVDYFKANQQRARTCQQISQIFQQYDAIITPTIGCAAVSINEQHLPTGALDAQETCKIMKYAPLANLTGIPAITVPVGYTSKEGLPIGFQIMSAWWREDVCLTIAQALEARFPKKEAPNFVQIIPEHAR